MNKPKRHNLDYKYGIFAKIARIYTGYDSNYWTNKQVKSGVIKTMYIMNQQTKE